MRKCLHTSNIHDSDYFGYRGIFHTVLGTFLLCSGLNIVAKEAYCILHPQMIIDVTGEYDTIATIPCGMHRQYSICKKLSN